MAVEIIDARRYRVRHIAPTSTYESEGGTATVLGKTYGFTELPLEQLPASAGLVEGSYTTRLGDSGEFSLTFPNAAGPKGLWRDRFSTDKALEFVEIYRDDVLEFVGSVQRVEIDRGTVTVSGPDAWSLLRRAYERDRSWTAAPRDVIESYTRVPVPRLLDDFDGGSLAAGWSVQPSGDVSTSVDDSRVTITVVDDSTARQGIEYDMGAVLGDSWRLTVVFSSGTSTLPAVTLRTPTDDYVIEATASGSNAEIRTRDDSLGSSDARAYGGTNAFPYPRTLVVERKGRWVSSYVNGRLAGFVQFKSVEGVDRVRIENRGAVGTTLVVESIAVMELQSFLARGSDLGDYVLPGDYPTGGLRGRYFNNGDLQGLSSGVRNARIMAPDREHYAERLDPIIDTSAGLSFPLQPGAGDYFSVRWQGAIYLRGDLGDHPFELADVDDGARLWIGKTAFSDELIDAWSGGPGTYTGTWDASDHGSTAGWYPIVLEYYEEGGGDTIRLRFTPPGSGTYTDPGGTTITRGTKISVPATSLSPLGCYDGRIQGQSHFDIVQQAAAQFGYQLTCEPMQLESGEFPGRLVPRERVGRDTDVILEPEDSDGVEPALSPGLTLESSDQTLVLIGSGAGIADGRGSQVSVEIADLANLDAGLFALENVVDAGEIAFPDLLEARLNAELALRATPWEEVRATPRAQERLADTWPLSDALSAMRWRPGDGVRLRVPDISVEDDEPRQMLQVTRSFTPEGRTATQVAFRQRPRSAARSVRSLLRAALLRGRSYQGTTVTLPGETVFSSSVAAGGFTDYSRTTLLPSDRVIRAYVRVTFNGASQSLGIEINGTDRTTELGGGWTTVPLDIDITAYASQASSTSNELYVRFENNGGSATGITHQLIVEVLR